MRVVEHNGAKHGVIWEHGDQVGLVCLLPAPTAGVVTVTKGDKVRDVRAPVPPHVQPLIPLHQLPTKERLTWITQMRTERYEELSKAKTWKRTPGKKGRKKKQHVEPSGFSPEVEKMLEGMTMEEVRKVLEDAGHLQKEKESVRPDL